MTTPAVQKSASETAAYVFKTTSSTARAAADVLRALIESGAKNRNTIDVEYINRVIRHLGKYYE